MEYFDLTDTIVNLRATKPVFEIYDELEVFYTNSRGIFANPTKDKITDLILLLVDDEEIELVADIVNLLNYFGLHRNHTLDRLFEALSIEVAEDGF